MDRLMAAARDEYPYDLFKSSWDTFAASQWPVEVERVLDRQADDMQTMFQYDLEDGTGVDTISGGSGDDLVAEGLDDDPLTPGLDDLFGGWGDDWLNEDLGYDLLIVGSLSSQFAPDFGRNFNIVSDAYKLTQNSVNGLQSEPGTGGKWIAAFASLAGSASRELNAYSQFGQGVYKVTQNSINLANGSQNLGQSLPGILSGGSLLFDAAGLEDLARYANVGAGIAGGINVLPSNPAAGILAIVGATGGLLQGPDDPVRGQRRHLRQQRPARAGQRRGGVWRRAGRPDARPRPGRAPEHKWEPISRDKDVSGDGRPDTVYFTDRKDDFLTVVERGTDSLPMKSLDFSVRGNPRPEEPQRRHHLRHVPGVDAGLLHRALPRAQQLYRTVRPRDQPHRSGA
jgi:hypothetical protein